MIIKQKRRAKIFILLFIVACLLIAGILTVGYSQGWGKRTSQDQPKTRTESSEGKKFEVPVDTPPTAIKDYILIKEDERFKIRQVPNSTTYIITLYAIINHPDQYSMYQDQLREYKQAALEYLKSTGVTIEKSTITYEPDEAKNL